MRQHSGWVGAVLALCVGARAGADIGVPVRIGDAGPFDVQALVTPAPLRVGPSDWNVVVSEAGGGRGLPDAELELSLRAPADASAPRSPAHDHGSRGGTLVLRPAPIQAGLFQLRDVELPVAGLWHGTLRVSREGASESVGFQLEVAPGSSALVAHWRAFAIVPGGVALLLLHQRLRPRPGTRSGAG